MDDSPTSGASVLNWTPVLCSLSSASAAWRALASSITISFFGDHSALTMAVKWCRHCLNLANGALLHLIVVRAGPCSPAGKENHHAYSRHPDWHDQDQDRAGGRPRPRLAPRWRAAGRDDCAAISHIAG